jgi:transposase
MAKAGSCAKKAASEPAALIGWFCALGQDLARVGLEAGPLSQWLYAGIKEAGLAVELIEPGMSARPSKRCRSRLTGRMREGLRS